MRFASEHVSDLLMLQSIVISIPANQNMRFGETGIAYYFQEAVLCVKHAATATA